MVKARGVCLSLIFRLKSLKMLSAEAESLLPEVDEKDWTLALL